MTYSAPPRKDEGKEGRVDLSQRENTVVRRCAANLRCPFDDWPRQRRAGKYLHDTVKDVVVKVRCDEHGQQTELLVVCSRIFIGTETLWL